MKNKILPIAITLIVILITSVLGSIFVYIGMPWYKALNIPSYWVPSILIPIVWTTIYLLFAIILSIMIENNLITFKTTILLILNALLNIVWCLTFFTLQNTLLGMVIIIANLILGIILIKHIFSINKIYGSILALYPYWLCIATCLNLAIWILN